MTAEWEAIARRAWEDESGEEPEAATQAFEVFIAFAKGVVRAGVLVLKKPRLRRSLSELWRTG